MDEYLIFASIGGLILLTLLVISMAEAYEQKQQETRLKILRIKQGIDNLGDLLDAIKTCEVGSEIQTLLVNEIIARLLLIQSLDRHFRGIENLLDEARNSRSETPKKDQSQFHIKNDEEFKSKMVLISHLLKLCVSHQWYSQVTTRELHQHLLELKLLRCEKIYQFYNDKATEVAEQGQYLLAKEHYNYILHALNASTIASNPRVAELIEQVTFMMGQMAKMLSKKKAEKAEKEAEEEQKRKAKREYD